MRDTTPRRLRFRFARGRWFSQGPQQPLANMTFRGLALTAAGLVFMTAPLVYEDMPDLGLLCMFPGIPAFLIGLLHLAFAWRGHLRVGKNKRLLRERPGEVWLVDYPWDTSGATYSDLGLALKFFWLAALFLVFMVILNAAIALDGERRALYYLIPFDLVGPALLIISAYLFFRRQRYGRSRLRYGRFPFFLGEGFDVFLRLSPPVAALPQLVLTLRCVEEKCVIGTEHSDQVESHQLYADTSEATACEYREKAELPVHFTLPRNGLATTFRDNPCRYWELEVRGRAAGIQYKAIFLLPIYKRPESATSGLPL